MAKDVITRFKLETTQFDSKIKQASKDLSNYSKTATQAKEGFNQFTKSNVDAARALGTMATSSTNAKQKTQELVGAFNEAAKAYNQLTKEQQQSDWAKALAGSLTQLQQRIKDAKQEMQSMGNEMKSSGGFLSGDKLSGMIQVFGGNLMTKGAGLLTGLADEMGQMIKQGIELAKQGEGIRIAFERLGRGDILDGLREATHGTVTDIELMKAAVKFSDFKLPVEELGTMLAFAQQKAKDTGQSVDYMVDSIVTGLGRKSLMILDNLGLSASEIKSRMKETGDMTKAVAAIIREQMAKAGDYVETASDRAAQANVNLQNKLEELGRKFAPIEESSNQLWTSMKIGILDIVGGPLTQLLNGLTEAGRMRNMLNGIGGNDQVNTQLGKLRVAKAAGSGYMTRSLYSEQIEQYNRQINAASGYLSQYDSKHSAVNTVLMAASKQFGQKFDSISDLRAFKDAYVSMKSEYVKGAKEIMNATKVTATTETSDTKKTKTKKEQTEIQQNQEKINKLSEEYALLSDKETTAARQRQDEILKEIQLLERRNGLLGLRMEQAQGRLLPSAGDFDKNTKNVGGVGLLDSTVSFGKDIAVPSGGLQLGDKQMRAVEKNLAKQQKNVGNIAKEWGSVASAIGAVGNAMAGIEDPAAKVLGIVAQAIATVALTFAKSLSGTLSPWDWIAAVAAGTASMISTISAIHSATGYAEGGLVKGNSYSGDNLMAMGPDGGLVGLNAGELVLNKSQQNNLANALQTGGMQGLQLTATIRGEQIRLALNNNGRRTGRGEYVQSKNLG